MRRPKNVTAEFRFREEGSHIRCPTGTSFPDDGATRQWKSGLRWSMSRYCPPQSRAAFSNEPAGFACLPRTIAKRGHRGPSNRNRTSLVVRETRFGRVISSRGKGTRQPVSYTHLTLPTSDLV